MKSLPLAAIVLLASLSLAKAQIFTVGGVNPSGSNIETPPAGGYVLYAANFDYGSATAVVNGVTFVGTNQVDGSYQSGNFSITGAGGIDGTGGGTLPNGTDTNASAGMQTLNEAGLYYNLTLTLNNLTPGLRYAAQLIVDGNSHDARSQAYADITNPLGVVISPTVIAGGNSNMSIPSAGNPGPQYITDTFLATGTSEVLQAQYGGGAGAQFSGFVLEATPEPGTWALMGCGLVSLLAFRRFRQRTA
jgi:hypothetical protein